MIDYVPHNKRTPDTQYADILEDILKNGHEVNPIHGEKAYMLGARVMRYDMRNGFPLVPIRDLSKSFKGAIGELVGFLHGARTLEQLGEYGCPKVFWDRWVTKERCDIFDLPPHDLGDGSYGAAWANFPMPDGNGFNQIEHVIRQIKEMPYLRTHLISPWIPFFALQHSKLKRKVVVAPCHGWVHVIAFPDRKELMLNHFQRSGDFPVGVVLNMVEYASLGMLIAKEIGYTFVEYNHMISDAHIYESQIPYVEKLLKREHRPFPTVGLDENVTKVLDGRREHFTLLDYDPHPHMNIPTPT